MPRTTLDIDEPVLRKIKDLQKKQGQSMGKIVSQLLAEALATNAKDPKQTRLKWISKPMHALVDLSDKDTIYKILDEKHRWAIP